MGDKPQRQRAYASGVAVQLFGGLMSVPLDVVPVRVPNLRKELTFPQICPECGTDPYGHPVRQRFMCDAGHGPFDTSVEPLPRAKEVDGNLVPVGVDEIEAVRTDPDQSEDDTKILSLRVHPAAELDANTLPGETAYRMRPGKGCSASAYAMLRELIRNPEVAVVGQLTLRGLNKLYRLTLFKDQVVAQSLIWPSDLAATDEIADAEVDPKLATLASQWVEANVEAFNADEYRNEMRDRVAALVAAKRENPDAKVELPKAPPAPAATTDIVALLEASLAAKKPAKKSKKKGDVAA